MERRLRIILSRLECHLPMPLLWWFGGFYRGQGLGLVTRFYWCAVRTAAGDSGFQRKTLRHERRSPGGSGGRRLRRFPAPSTPRLAVCYESLLLLHTHFDAELCCEFHGEFIIIIIAHGESDGGGERAGPLRARPRLALVARGGGARRRRTPPPRGVCARWHRGSRAWPR